MPREPWIGERYTLQIPAYYYTLKVIHRKRSLEISPKDILEEALRGRARPTALIQRKKM